MNIETCDFSGVADPHNPGMDYGAAWAIQRDVGEQLQHAPRCSSVAGWHPLSGPSFLCDCGAVLAEWKRRLAVQAKSGHDSEDVLP